MADRPAAQLSSKDKLLSLRFAFWDSLPWSLVRLADWDVPKARAAASDSMAKFDLAIAGDNLLHHPLTTKVFSPQSEIRALVIRFINGEPLSALGPLGVLVWQLLFVPIAERVQEGEHAIVMEKTRFHSVTGPYVSFAIRGSKCLATLRDDVLRPRFSAILRHPFRNVQLRLNRNLQRQALAAPANPNEPS